MGKHKLPALVAGMVFVVAWFLPVERDAALLAEGTLPGWAAFRVAFWPATQHPFADLDLMTLREFLCAVSALSNVLVLYTLALVLWWPRSGWPTLRWMSKLLLVAFALNVQWIWPRGGEFLDLRSGYWLWVASFPLLAIAAWRLEHVRGEPMRRRAGDRRRPDGGLSASRIA